MVLLAGAQGLNPRRMSTLGPLIAGCVVPRHRNAPGAERTTPGAFLSFRDA